MTIIDLNTVLLSEKPTYSMLSHNVEFLDTKLFKDSMYYSFVDKFTVLFMCKFAEKASY